MSGISVQELPRIMEVMPMAWTLTALPLAQMLALAGEISACSSVHLRLPGCLLQDIYRQHMLAFVLMTQLSTAVDRAQLHALTFSGAGHGLLIVN